MAVISTLAKHATFPLSHFCHAAAQVGLAVVVLLLTKGVRWFQPFFGWRPVVTYWAVPDDAFKFRSERRLASFPGLSRDGRAVPIVLSVRRDVNAKARADGTARYVNEQKHLNPNAFIMAEMFFRYAKEAGVTCHDPNKFSKGTCIARRWFRRWCLGLCQKSHGRPPEHKCWAHCFRYHLSGQESEDKPIMVQILESGQKPTPNQQEEIAIAKQLGVEIFIATSTTNHGEVEFLLYKAEQTDSSCVVEPKSPQTPWLLAVESGSLEMVELLVNKEEEKGAINLKDSNGRSPLFLAARSGSSQMVELLISAGADKEALDDSGFSPLQIAAMNGQTEAVRILLQSCADKNKAYHRTGATAMHFAAIHGHEETVQVLLDSGADPRIVNALGKDPLYAAAEEEVKKHQCHNLPVVQLLLDAGIEVEETLRSVTEKRMLDEEVAHFLREARANKGSGKIPEHGAPSEPAFFHDKNGKHLYDGCQVVLCGQNEVELNGKHGQVIGTEKSQRDKSKARLIVRILHSERDVKVHPRNVERWFGPESGVVQNQDPFAPPASQEEAVALALELDPSLSPEEALEMAAYLQSEEVQKEARKRAEEKVKSRISDLFDSGAPLNVPYPDGRWPAHVAAEAGNTGLLQLFHAWEYTLDAEDPDGRTPGHLGAAAGHVEVVTILHQFGCRFDVEDRDGRTPADLAAAAGHDEVLAALDELGYRPQDND